ncbi:MAG: FAD-dependent oxidoreductase [Parvularculaceae bacterium]
MPTATPLPARTDVLIVGAGPTGLALAISLAQAGIDHVLIDKLPTPQNASRAAVIHAHTLEALQPLGVVSDLAKEGLKLTRFSFRDRGHTLARLDFGDLPSAFSYILMIPQDATEAIFTKRLEDIGGRIHRGVSAVAMDPHAHGVRVWLDAGDGVQRAIDARYVVGADGMRSVVRESAGIDFDGGVAPQSFVLADVRMDWPEGREEVMLFFTENGPLVIAPLADGSFRVVAAMEDAPEKLTLADIAAIIDAHGPGRGARVTDVVWSSRFRIHHRLAKTYRNGRLLIMGDAAHVHSPAGGQGMNTGLVDATVLGGLLAQILNGARPEADIDMYEMLRRPAAAKVLRLASSLTHMAMTRGAVARRMRNAKLSLAGRIPPVRRKLVMNLSGLSRRNAAVLPPQPAERIA